VTWHGRYVSNLALPFLIQTEADGCNVALQWLNVLSLKAVSHWDIAQLVPLAGEISYESCCTDASSDYTDAAKDYAPEHRNAL
jgi:hypothetical protein